MIEMLMDHKEWIFSGIGVFFFTLFRKRDVSQVLKIFASAAATVYTHLISVFYPKSLVVTKVNIDLRPRHKPFELWLNELPKCKLWLRGINFNSFDITIKHITIEFNYGGVNVKCDNFMHRCVVPRLSFNDVILFEGNLTTEQADYIAGLEDGQSCHVSIKAVLKTPTKEITYEHSYMDGIEPALVNANGRKDKMRNKSMVAEA
ncbi:hypothetical protein [Pseudoalteromonas ardens]|uniref:Uncharacterized protein n=1 Tax=Pseudoalteromonas rubra TaxID=43658 RepID=A0A0L0EP21_9GAMM|nr:hypothetical protein [Pseudoalteromonas sp. R96]KNC66115.1 hypothetical protein AC626_18970 [Pseudoalteromonas rubra]MDK1313650.1 hypothetical protein [Pseudoalteromonas sp. R96]